ncbi:MAG: hypothetical protein WB949_12960 [Candidatus Acidiferrales bacterium]
MSETGWVALGVAATLLGILLAHRFGLIQISLMKREHALNISKAAQKIGTSVCFEQRQHPTHPVKNLYIVTDIYNQGDLAASKLEGNWKLSCSENSLNRTLSISVDHLGNSRPHKIELQFGGMGMLGIIQQGKDVHIEIDIDSVLWTYE